MNTHIDERPLPAEVICLEELRIELTKNDCEPTLSYFFKKKLERACAVYEHTDDERVFEHLAKAWLTYAEYLSRKCIFAETWVAGIDPCFRYITRKNLGADLRTDDRTLKTAAFLITARVLSAGKSKPHPRAHNTKTFISQVFDINVSETELVDVAEIVSKLYGGATWELYQNEVEWPDDLPFFLWKNCELSVAMKKHSKAAIDVLLPNDFM